MGDATPVHDLVSLAALVLVILTTMGICSLAWIVSMSETRNYMERGSAT